jgi:hypothetical protein
LIGFFEVKSVKIRQLEDEGKWLLDESDKRNLDFFWRHETMPLQLSIRIITSESSSVDLEKCMDSIKGLDIPENWELDIEIFTPDNIQKGNPYPRWKLKDIRQVKVSHPRFFRNVTENEILSYSSHLSAIKSSSADILLVLEDTSNFRSDFLYRIDQALQELRQTKWNAIDFGREPIEFSEFPITQSLVKMGYTHHSHCILYSKEGIEKIKLVDETVNLIPFDDFLCGLRNAHPRQEINEMHDIESMIIYQSYTKLSWKRANGADNISEENYGVLEVREVDPDDYTNYYRYSNDLNYSLANIRDKVVRANRRMWNFQIMTIQDAGLQSYSDWHMSIDATKKLVVVAGATSLELYTDEPLAFESPSSDIFIFPSYMLLKCESARVFYACGNSFL